MIIDLPSTSTRTISKELVRLRVHIGAVTLGRVMSLIVIAAELHADEAIDAAIEASREHPSRILVLVEGSRRGSSRLDAQVRVGGDAGASEVVVLRMYGELAGHGESVVTPLLLPDSPVVAWWAGPSPADLADTPIGRIATRRISDSSSSTNPTRELARRATHYRAGDTDMAWARTTRWRTLLATALDQEPFEPVTSVVVKGAPDSASSDLMAAWLASRLRCPVRRTNGLKGTGLNRVQLDRASGPIVLDRTAPSVAVLEQPGQQPRRFPMPRPSTAMALTEELRRLDRDEVYQHTLRSLGDVTRGAKKSAPTKGTS